MPSYDKSAFDGQGDRNPQKEWKTVNRDGEDQIEVVIFEGWCVGFRALEPTDLLEKWEHALKEKEKDGYRGRLGLNQLEDLEFINEALRKYDSLTEYGGPKIS